MTEKKFIDRAAAAHAKAVWKFGEEQFACMDGFHSGAKWMALRFPRDLWHDATEEPDPTLNAWIIMQTGKDSWCIVKYGGYNKDGGQTWQREAEKGYVLRWCYLSDILPKKGGMG